MRTTPSSASPAPGGLRTSLRALLAVGLLVGFYLLAVGWIAAVVGIDVALAVNSRQPFGSGGLKVYVLSAAAIYPVVRVVFLSRRPRVEDEPFGLAVTPEDEPALWERVRQLAALAGTRQPAEIRLIPDVNAAVTEDTRLLGLFPGRRRLLLGVPLLIGLIEAELDAVLAHELGHFSNQDTRLGGLTYTGRRAVTHAAVGMRTRAARKKAEDAAELAALAADRRTKGRKARRQRKPRGGIDQVLAVIFSAYARLYLTVSQSVSRRQEYAADLAAARIAGRDATARALRKLPLLDEAQPYYLRTFGTLGWEAGLLPLPGQVYGGLAHLLADPRFRAELGELELPEGEPDPYDTHPPLAARIAALESLPADGRNADASRPGLALLTRPDRTLAAVETATLRPEAATMIRLDWPELAQRAGRAQHLPAADVLRQATRILGLPADATSASVLALVLDQVSAGRWWELADCLPRSGRARDLTGRAAREFARPVFRSAVEDLVMLALSDAGLARWELSWFEGVQRRLPDGFAASLPQALDALVTDPPNVAPLRSLLASAGLELTPAR